MYSFFVPGGADCTCSLRDPAVKGMHATAAPRQTVLFSNRL